MSLLNYKSEFKRDPVLAWYCHIMDMVEDGSWRDLDALIRFYENAPNSYFSIALRAILTLSDEIGV